MNNLVAADKIASWTKGKWRGAPLVNQNLRIASDSRKIINPPVFLFVALQGVNRDGHDYISELLESGVVHFVVSEGWYKENKPKKGCFFCVENTLHALQNIAGGYRQEMEYPVVGITGSNGKTIVKEWLNYLLADKFNIVRSPRSHNSQLGVPLSLLRMKKENELALIEAGISKPHEMEVLQQLIQPDIGVFTHLGQAHIQNFSSQQAIAEEKLKLFATAKSIVFCADQKIIATAISKTKLKQFSWSRKGLGTLQVVRETEFKDQTEIKFTYKKKTYNATLPVEGGANTNNAYTCICALLALGLKMNDIISRLDRLAPVAMRLERIEGEHGNVIINDAYSADLDALELALQFLNQHAKEKTKIAVLSAPLETGLSGKVLAKRIAKMLGQFNVKKLFLISDVADFSTEIARHFTTVVGNDLAELNTKLKKLKNSAILVKGSRTSSLEKVVTALQFQSHRTVLVVNLNSFGHNFRAFGNRLQPETKIMVMVKAFAYGAGIKEVAGLLAYNGADYFGVAYSDEGVQLRKSGISEPIMVMNPAQESFGDLVKYKLEPEIYSHKRLKQFLAFLKAKKISDWPIHLKVETGMNRLGFEVEELASALDLACHEQAKGKKLVKIAGLFSHLAAADDEAHDNFTRQQIQKFEKAKKIVAKRLGYMPICHLANTSGIVRFADAEQDMVRLGVGLYGVDPTDSNLELEPVLRLRTVISQVKTVAAGQSVGYSRNFVAARKTRIGILPIGYADGLDRRLGNGIGHFYVNGSKVPSVGNICMDMTMVDLSDISANEGDEVEIFGVHVSIDEIADQLKTIPYEVLTSIGERVKRIYVQE